MRNTNHVVSRGLLGLVALAALGVAAPAHAQVVIYNNFGADDSYKSQGGSDITGTPKFDIAGFFTTGADGYDNIVFEGAFNHIRGTPDLTMRLMGDLGGLPDEGVVLATSSPLIPVAYPGSILTWTLNPTVTLTANSKYWFVASATLTDGWDAWHDNDQGATGAAVKYMGTWYLNTGAAPAFRVRGNVLGAGAVPEPSEWAAMGVLGLALGGLVVRKRRTR